MKSSSPAFGEYSPGPIHSCPNCHFSSDWRIWSWCSSPRAGEAANFAAASREVEKLDETCNMSAIKLPSHFMARLDELSSCFVLCPLFLGSSSSSRRKALNILKPVVGYKHCGGNANGVKLQPKPTPPAWPSTWLLLRCRMPKPLLMGEQGKSCIVMQAREACTRRFRKQVFFARAF